MGVRIIQADGEGDSQGAVLYCSTTMWAFGPVFEDADEAEKFLDWLVTDPRSLSDGEMETKYGEFLRAQEQKAEESK